MHFLRSSMLTTVAVAMLLLPFAAAQGVLPIPDQYKDLASQSKYPYVSARHVDLHGLSPEHIDLFACITLGRQWRPEHSNIDYKDDYSVCHAPANGPPVIYVACIIDNERLQATTPPLYIQITDCVECRNNVYRNIGYTFQRASCKPHLS